MGRAAARDACGERLASFGRLIMFDKRGTGLSDPIADSALPTIEEWMADVSVSWTRSVPSGRP